MKWPAAIPVTHLVSDSWQCMAMYGSLDWSGGALAKRRELSERVSHQAIVFGIELWSLQKYSTIYSFALQIFFCSINFFH
jgi:hypothetical protein